MKQGLYKSEFLCSSYWHLILQKSHRYSFLRFISGTLIPHIVCLPNVELRSSAKYVLLIEKDATFQRLLNENVLDELSDSLIVTVSDFFCLNFLPLLLVHVLKEYWNWCLYWNFLQGKGFPDINTRMLINKLNKNLKLPILALVDADPFGIAIMCVYRFGSLVVLSIQPVT